MMTTHQTQHRAVQNGKKVQCLAVLAFFLCASLSTHAQSNIVDGTAYGTNYAMWATAPSIYSISNGAGNLYIGYTNTASITLSNKIDGAITIDNTFSNFAISATGSTVSNGQYTALAVIGGTNLTITGGTFIGSGGGYITNSVAHITGSEVAGVNDTDGFTMERSDLVVSNSTFRGGDSGIGLVALDHSTVTIHSGSFTGGEGTTAFYLQDSDVTVYGGTFAGNIDETNSVAGEGLFSELTEATTNHVTLHGGDFSSLAFYSTNGAVQHFLAGTNLIVRNGIIQNGGTVIVDNQNDSALTNILVLSGTMDFTTNSFSLLDGGILGFGVSESTNGLLTAQTAYFHTNSTLEVDASTAGFSSGTNEVVLLSTASGNSIYMIGTSTNLATDADFTTNNVGATVSGRSTLNDVFVDNGQFLRFQFTTEALREYWDATGQLGDLADELDRINNTAMMAAIDTIDDPNLSKAATEETYFTVRNTFQTVLHGMQAAVGPSVSRGAEYREQLKLKSPGSSKQRRSGPSGARGPQRSNDLRGWAKYYGQRYSHDADGLNPEYDTDLDGGVIGVDKSLGSLLVGISGGYGRYNTTTGIDGEEDITAYHGSLYGTLGIGKAYIDAGVAYGFNEVENQTTSPFVLNGEFDAQILSAYLGGGMDLVDSKEGMVFTPEASIQYSMYEQEAYSETSDNAVPRNIDAFDADSLRGSIGLNVSIQDTMKMETFSLKYDVRAHWIREFNPEPGNMNFSLAGGTESYDLAVPLLDEDLYRIGIGCSFFNTKRNQPKNVLFRIDFDELFGDGFNSHNFSAKVVYAF